MQKSRDLKANIIVQTEVYICLSILQNYVCSIPYTDFHCKRQTFALNNLSFGTEGNGRHQCPLGTV